MKKLLSLLLALVMMVSIVPVQAFAKVTPPYEFDISDDDELTSLQSHLKEGKDHYGSGDVITVTGTRTAAADFTLYIPAGVTVNWEADYNGDTNDFILNGAGNFTLTEEGSVEKCILTCNLESGNFEDGNLTVSGTVNSNGYGLNIKKGTKVVVDGGTVTGDSYGIGIFDPEAKLFVINDSTITSTYSTGIHYNPSSAPSDLKPRVTIQNSTVKGGNERAAVESKGGTVSLIDQVRIESNGKAVFESLNGNNVLFKFDINSHVVLKGGAASDVSLKGPVSLTDSYYLRTSDTAELALVNENPEKFFNMADYGTYFEIVTGITHLIETKTQKDNNSHTVTLGCKDATCINHYERTLPDEAHNYGGDSICDDCGHVYVVPTTFNITNDEELASLQKHLSAEKTYYTSGTEITVTGTKEIGTELGVKLHIPSGVTVNWQADLTVRDSGDARNFPGLLVSGAGTLNVFGSIEAKDHNGNSWPLSTSGSTKIIVTGAVKSIGNHGSAAIYSTGTGDIYVDGGKGL